MLEPVLNWSWITVRHTWFLIFSISNVTRETSLRSSGSAQVSTNRFAGTLSTTLPVIQTSFPLATFSHFEPFFQSETLPIPAQYWRANCGLVMASHVFFGVERMKVV
jgi:hypothetical protein